jgi:hypothetical protein
MVPPCCMYLFANGDRRGIPALWGALKRRDVEAEQGPEPRLQTPTPVSDSSVRLSTPTPVYGSRPRADPPIVVGTIYRVRKHDPEPLLHARTLIEHVQLYAEDAVGTYVPSRELKRFYGELCEREGWAPQSWTAIGSRLSQLTDGHKRLKRGGRQFWAHLIPRPDDGPKYGPA